MIYVPFLQQAFSTAALSARRLAVLHGGRKLGAVAARAEQGHHARAKENLNCS